MEFLVSAGEASGDRYAAGVVSHLRDMASGSRFYGCVGPRLRAAGAEAVVDAEKLSVVGLAEVVGHLPRIYGEYRKLVKLARERRPGAALLVDSPDFHLRLARQLHRMGVPVFYLVAPQAWAWREGRVRTIRQNTKKLFCLFPFEESWFRQRGVDATYIGHPLAAMARPSCSRAEFFSKHGLDPAERMIVLLPGSRAGEARRHLPYLLETVAALRAKLPLRAVLATPEGFGTEAALANFRERISALSIQVIENETWDAIAHADVALAASGTVTIEAAVLGTPMVTFYRVNPLSWRLGRRLVKVPFLSMVNLAAGSEIVPEFMQEEMTPANLAAAVEELLSAPERAKRMKADLARVRESLTSTDDPLRRAADLTLDALGPRSIQEKMGTYARQ
jgi:lipid-A-disaccharide synthase